MTFVNVHTHHQDLAGPAVLSIRNIIVGQDTIQPDQPTAYSIGIHPWYIHDLNTQVEQLRRWAGLPTVWAIGECGLDRLISMPLTQQQVVFEQQIQLAEEIGKPMIIHCVRAVAEVVHLRKKYQPTQPWILHGFNNRPTLLDPLVANDFYISLGAALLRPDSPAARALPHIPANRLLFETDDKVIAIQDVYRAAAELLQQPVSELTNQIWHNVATVFRASS